MFRVLRFERSIVGAVKMSQHAPLDTAVLHALAACLLPVGSLSTLAQSPATHHRQHTTRRVHSLLDPSPDEEKLFLCLLFSLSGKNSAYPELTVLKKAPQHAQYQKKCPAIAPVSLSPHTSTAKEQTPQQIPRTQKKRASHPMHLPAEKAADETRRDETPSLVHPPSLATHPTKKHRSRLPPKTPPSLLLLHPTIPFPGLNCYFLRESSLAK